MKIIRLSLNIKKDTKLNQNNSDSLECCKNYEHCKKCHLRDIWRFKKTFKFLIKTAPNLQDCTHMAKNSSKWLQVQSFTKIRQNLLEFVKIVNKHNGGNVTKSVQREKVLKAPKRPNINKPNFFIHTFW